MKHDHITAGVGQIRRSVDNLVQHLRGRWGVRAGDAKTGDMDAHIRRGIAVEMGLGEPIAGRDDQTDPGAWVHHESPETELERVHDSMFV